MTPVRRSLAGLLFGVGFACACLALSGLLLERTAFSADHAADSAYAVLQDDTLQAEVVRAISAGTATQIYPTDAAAAATITENIGIVTRTEVGSELLAELVRDAHAQVIGSSDDPVVISPAELVQIVRDERAVTLPPLTLDVPRVGALAVTASVLGWLVPISGIAAIVLFVLCFLARPERPALIRTLGFGLWVLAASLIVFGYVVPRFVPTLLDDSPWARIGPALAADSLVFVIGVALVLSVFGLALFTMSNRMGRSRRWSTPVSTYRYREERRWS
jgi:hypothetical protein